MIQSDSGHEQIQPDSPKETGSSPNPEIKRIRVRRKVKVKRRIRVKKKPSVKKKIKKLFGTVLWIVVILSFIVTLVVMIVQLDIKDEKTKKKSKKKRPAESFQIKQQPDLLYDTKRTFNYYLLTV